MFNKTKTFSCNSCDSEFEIIAHSDFEEDDVAFCPLCGDNVNSEDDLLDYMDEIGED